MIKYLHKLLIISFVSLLVALNCLGQAFLPTLAQQDSFQGYDTNPSTWMSRWEKGSLSNCASNNSIAVDYSSEDPDDFVNRTLDISPLSSTSGTNINGFVSKYKMNFQNSFVQTEVFPATANVVTELSMGLDCNNWYRVYRKGNSLQFQSRTAGGSVNTIASITYNSTLHRYWRIRHNPTTGKIVFETGEIITNSVPDPDNPPQTIPKEKKLVWTQRAETTINFSISEVRFEIVGGTDSSVSSPEIIKFDNFLFDSNNSAVVFPQQEVDTTYPINLGGSTISVTNCNQLQSAFNNSQPGDTISISPSLTCIGNFTLPAKSNPNNKYIVIRSSSSEFESNGVLRPGRRVNGEDSAHTQYIPKIFSNNTLPALFLPAGANYYRIVGIGFGLSADIPEGFINNSLVELETSANQVNHVIFDRCYFNGGLELYPSGVPRKNIKRAIALLGSHLAVIDSYLSNLIAKGWQNQAIGIWSGTGPIKIENNYLEALTQNILIGGGGTATTNQSVADVVIRRNFFEKRDSLFQAFGCSVPINAANCPGFAPTNGIELKQGLRIQITENIFNQTLEGIYVRGGGDSVCQMCLTENILVKNNKFLNVRKPFVLVTETTQVVDHTNYPDYTPWFASHVTAENNLAYFTNLTSDVIGEVGSWGFSARGDVASFKLIHNTYESERYWQGTDPGSVKLPNFEMRDNIFEKRSYGLREEEPEGFNNYFFPYTFRKNVIVNNSEFGHPDSGVYTDNQLRAIYPCTSLDSFCAEIGFFVPSSWDSNESTGDQVGFVQGSLSSRRSSGNYRLASNSPYKNIATDGKDIGVNQNILETAICGTLSGMWENCDQTPFDFDGDGVSDISVFRSSNNTWNILESSGGLPIRTSFGASGDILVPADYDGDFKTDLAIFRPSTGYWWVLKSEDNVGHSFQFGASGDIPAPADYDGDGKADAAVFRPSNGHWYILNSGGGTTAQQFGASGDLPVAADYDGDGKADIAIFRPSNGQWWLNRSSAGVMATTFGTSTDKTVQGDYTGDGKADVAVWRPSNGHWYILRSEDFSFYAVPFGLSGDIPTPADYDGDGLTDVAVFRPSNITWYLQRSTSGFTSVGFETTGDIPIPSVYVR